MDAEKLTTPETINAEMLLVLKRFCLSVEFRIDDPRAALRDHALKVVAQAERLHCDGFRGGYG